MVTLWSFIHDYCNNLKYFPNFKTICFQCARIIIDVSLCYIVYLQLTMDVTYMPSVFQSSENVQDIEPQLPSLRQVFLVVAGRGCSFKPICPIEKKQKKQTMLIFVRKYWLSK